MNRGVVEEILNNVEFGRILNFDRYVYVIKMQFQLFGFFRLNVGVEKGKEIVVKLNIY